MDALVLLIMKNNHIHSFLNGICSICGNECRHASGYTKLDSTYHYCNACNLQFNHGDYIYYSSSEHKCKYCSHRISHNWTKTAETHYCPVCTPQESHRFSASNGKCYVCGYGCLHPTIQQNSQDKHKCSVCGYLMDHSFVSDGQTQGHTCSICGYHSSHSFINGKCNRCGYTCVHITPYVKINDNQHKCSICNMYMNHTYIPFDSENHICSGGCGATGKHVNNGQGNCICGSAVYDMVLSNGGVAAVNGKYTTIQLTKHDNGQSTFMHKRSKPYKTGTYYVHEFKETIPCHYGSDLYYTFWFFIITNDENYNISTLNPSDLLKNTDGQYKIIHNFTQYDTNKNIIASVSDKMYIGTGMGSIPTISVLENAKIDL